MPGDNQIAWSEEELVSCGIEDKPQAIRNIGSLFSRFGRDVFPDLLRRLFPLLSSSADPDMALNNFERFVSGLDDLPAFLAFNRANPELLGYLITIFGASRFLSTFLVLSRDEAIRSLSTPGFITGQSGKDFLSERLASRTRDAEDEKSFFRALRLFRKQEMLRIGLRDLLRKADLQETVADLSDLAESCLQKAYEWADARLKARYGRPVTPRPDGSLEPARFAVIAMGKLGGRELNFSSDVDLMYVYSADGETEGVSREGGGAAGRITNHQYFVKLSEKLTAAIGEKTEDGFVFRVDLRLRPEGQRGPLAQSIGGYEIYYESWGQMWERSALIKARHAAGDESLSREFIERIEPFIYRKYLDFTAIAEIRDMKQKINKDVRQKGRIYRDVKLGYGGIREIEFVIQSLELIYGGRDRMLRERNSLKALQMLSQKGLITYQEQADLAKAYVFLRTVEHRIQILDDLQTQTISADRKEIRTLARRTGYLEQGREAEQLIDAYTAHAGKVRNIYDRLFAFTGEEKESGLGEYDRLLDPDASEQKAIALLEKYRFADPEKAYRNLLMLREGAAFVHQTPRSRKLFHEIFPSLFHEIVNSPDPDMALNHLESFLASQGSWESFQSLINIDASSVKVLIAIFGGSEYFSRMLISRPFLLENLLELRKTSGLSASGVFAAEFEEALSRSPGIADKMDSLRQVKHLEEIRIGMADLLSNADITAVFRDLSKLAEACLEAALKIALSEVGRAYGHPSSSSGLAIIGVGKLGGRELTYGSDLDILFVFSESHAGIPPAGLSVFEFFTKVAEKILSYLTSLTREGFAFRVDTRLRPGGSKGPLAQSIEAFKNHYALHAGTWERQALLKARRVAGDRIVGAHFCSSMQELIYRESDRNALADDIRSMRIRIEEELGKEDALHYNIKQGTGGLVDIEFLVQYLQLLHGKNHPWARLPGTLDALRGLYKSKLLNEADYRLLRGAYLFMRKLQSRLRIVANEATNRLSRSDAGLQRLAGRMGYRDDNLSAGRELLDDYEDLRGQVREIFTRLLGPKSHP